MRTDVGRTAQANSVEKYATRALEEAPQQPDTQRRCDTYATQLDRSSDVAEGTPSSPHLPSVWDQRSLLHGPGA